MTVEPAEWAIQDGNKILAKITQIPLRLAWAITVHKIQGMWLDAAVIDLAQAFEYRAGYVAISRVRTLAGSSRRVSTNARSRCIPSRRGRPALPRVLRCRAQEILSIAAKGERKIGGEFSPRDRCTRTEFGRRKSRAI